MSNHLLVQLQRQHILLSYFKTLSVGPVWGPNPRPPAQQTGALPTELTRRRFVLYKHLFEHYHHPCDRENRVVAKTFENIITQPSCHRCWGWFVGLTALHFYLE